MNTVWWFAKTDFPKADVRRVLAPYSERMKKLLEDAESFYRPKLRPSGHDLSRRFASDNGGAIPSNLLQIPNTESNSPYQRHCASVGVKPHPARFPEKLPTFFIEFLTDPGDTVLDIFAGSNTTGSAAEKLDRRWMAFEIQPNDQTYREVYIRPTILKSSVRLVFGRRRLREPFAAMRWLGVIQPKPP